MTKNLIIVLGLSVLIWVLLKVFVGEEPTKVTQPTEPQTQSQVGEVWVNGINEVKEEFLSKAPTLIHNDQTYIDLRKITPTNKKSVGAMKLHKPLLDSARKKLSTYGIVLPHDLKLTHEDWTYLQGLRSKLRSKCAEISHRRNKNHGYLWEDAWKAGLWKKATSKVEFHKERLRIKKAKRIFKIRVTKNGKYIYSFSRKEAPELFKYEDEAAQYWRAYLAEFLLLVVSNNKI